MPNPLQHSQKSWLKNTIYQKIEYGIYIFAFYFISNCKCLLPVSDCIVILNATFNTC